MSQNDSMRRWETAARRSKLSSSAEEVHRMFRREVPSTWGALHFYSSKEGERRRSCSGEDASSFHLRTSTNWVGGGLLARAQCAPGRRFSAIHCLTHCHFHRFRGCFLRRAIPSFVGLCIRTYPRGRAALLLHASFSSGRTSFDLLTPVFIAL